MAWVVAERPERRGAWVATLQDGTVVAFAIAHRSVDEAELETIVTAPEYQRQGAGAALLRRFVAWSRETGAVRMLLECRASNSVALRLYRRSGFSEEGRRKAYYRNPDEDAVLMSCSTAPPV